MSGTAQPDVRDSAEINIYTVLSGTARSFNYLISGTARKIKDYFYPMARIMWSFITRRPGQRGV